jgi:hypothetical protein
LERLFALPRPQAMFEERSVDPDSAPLINPQTVVVRGVARRRDLFEPRALLDRVPVDVLRIKPGLCHHLHGLPLGPEEIAFIQRLKVPTPLTMALWKRGLDPRHAGAVVVALNLLGAFEEWTPGDLPRVTLVHQILRLIRNGASDHTLLGVETDASDREVDRAFRRLSLMLHPDRVTDLPEPEAQRANDAFVQLNRAHARLKRSRRSRPGRSALGDAEIIRDGPWWPLLRQARTARQRGDHRRARAYAVKALALSPPIDAIREIKSILRQVA